MVEFWLSKWQIALNMKDLTAERRYITMAIVFGPCDQDLYAKRSHIAFLQADWVTALHDVNQVTTVWVYAYPCSHSLVHPSETEVVPTIYTCQSTYCLAAATIQTV